MPSPVTSQAMPCPVCRTGTVSGIYLYPLSLACLDRAVELRKVSARKAAEAATNNNGKRNRDEEYHEIQAEAPYLLLAHRTSAGGGSMSMNSDLHRTGRWTAAEIAFVDLLLSAFDNGTLPLPHGIKLNEFLGDILLCKSSRLTKKMKNAKLSTRSYELLKSRQQEPDYVLLSTLQHKFLQSVPSEPTQLELLFNITKLWRTQLSNLCVQVGYTMLNATEWLRSLDDMENRASKAEESIRKARRKRMSLALKADTKEVNPGVFFAGQPVKSSLGKDDCEKDAVALPQPSTALSSSIDFNPAPIAINPPPIADPTNTTEVDFLHNLLDAADSSKGGSGRQRLFSEDFSVDLEDLFEPSSMGILDGLLGKQETKTFLESLSGFMESHNLPFDYADIWVPSRQEDKFSFVPGKNDSVRLFNGGHTTRADIDPSKAMQFNEWGMYSAKFSFAPGIGLPGRVFISGKPLWEANIDEADPKYFERVGGARIYGIKTCLGFRLPTSFGFLVVAFYSLADIPKNHHLIEQCVSGIAAYIPEAKWRLSGDFDRDPKSGLRMQNNSGLHPQNVASTALKMPDDAMSMPMRNNADMKNKQSELLFVDHSRRSVTQSSAPQPPMSTTLQFPGQKTPQAPPDKTQEEQSIASLLGQFMPLSDGQQNSAMGTSDLLRDFMELRLLLLRPQGRRSEQEDDLIDVLRNSFRGYSVDNRRSGAELANLLVRDWQFLRATTITPQAQQPQQQQQQPSQATQHEHRSLSVHSAPSFTDKPPAMAPTGQYQSHMMDIPAMRSRSSSAPSHMVVPMRGQSQFSNSIQSQASNVLRRGSASAFEPNNVNFPMQRKISLTEVPESPQSSKRRINVVDEH